MNAQDKREVVYLHIIKCLLSTLTYDLKGRPRTIKQEFPAFYGREWDSILGNPEGFFDIHKHHF